MVTERRVLCSGCDIYCQVLAEVPESGQVGEVRVKGIACRVQRAVVPLMGHNHA